jgi:hypothetical protein
MMIILATALLFLPLTGTVNNTASASRSIVSYTGDPELDRMFYESQVKAYISCVDAYVDYNNFFPRVHH